MPTYGWQADAEQLIRGKSRDQLYDEADRLDEEEMEAISNDNGITASYLGALAGEVRRAIDNL